MSREIGKAANSRIVSKIRAGIRAVCAAWWLELRSVVCSDRWLVVSLLSFLLMIFYLRGILDMADTYGLGINPVVLPFLFSDSTFGNLGQMVLVFLMSVFPFRDGLQRGIRMKAGNKCYGIAQILTMISLALLWMAELQLLSMLVIGPRCSFGSWGKIWGTCASGQAAELGFSIAVEVDMNIILNYEPIAALLMSVLFAALTSIIFAEIIFLADTLTGYGIGEIILAVYCFGFYALSSMGLTRITQVLGKFDPTSWMNISNYMLKEGTLGRTLLRMGLILVVLATADYQVIRHKIIEEARD